MVSMELEPETPAQPRIALDEVVNALTHGVGAVLSVAALIAMITTTPAIETDAVLSLMLYGVTLVLLYTASTLYHTFAHTKACECLRRFDHACIYLLIAGTYTPYALLVLGGTAGIVLCVVIWVLAFAGVTLKSMIQLDRYDRLSLISYLAMGWIGVVAAGPLIDNLAPSGLVYLVLGGLSYTGGVVFYVWEELPFNHALWHLCVMAGSALHFASVFLYVLPS